LPGEPIVLATIYETQIIQVIMNTVLLLEARQKKANDPHRCRDLQVENHWFSETMSDVLSISPLLLLRMFVTVAVIDL